MKQIDLIPIIVTDDGRSFFVALKEHNGARHVELRVMHQSIDFSQATITLDREQTEKLGGCIASFLATGRLILPAPPMEPLTPEGLKMLLNFAIEETPRRRFNAEGGLSD